MSYPHASPSTPRRPVFPDIEPQGKHTHSHAHSQAIYNADPTKDEPGFFRGLGKAMLATAIFRCWHFILFFTIEAIVVTYVHQKGIQTLAIESTLMNVLGTVLGFVISYRSSSAFDRYNEGRKYWSQIVYNIRMFSRVVWFHISDEPTGNMKLGAAKDVEEYRARMLVEKKTVLNLLLGYAVALKHYLRGEDGHHYADLFHLIKFLPAYALPAGITVETLPSKRAKKQQKQAEGNKLKTQPSISSDALPLPATSASLRNRNSSSTQTEKYGSNNHTVVSAPPTQRGDVLYLLPARDPPGYHVFDFWPMSLFVRSMQKRGKTVRGRKALRDRARNGQLSGNVPLEITLYLSSYIASLQQRGADGSSTGQMSTALGQMVDALTGLERILQTPIPFSYAVHLWTVTLVWLVALPFQILKPLGWLTIPGVALAAFVYCGLMKSAEELENPFGYDLNDLSLDHFTHNIIRKELQALTALPMPDPTKWAFSPDNDAVFDPDGQVIYMDCSDEPRPQDHDVASPEEWVKRGEKDIRAALSATVAVSQAHVSSNHAGSNHHGVIAAGAIAGADIGATEAAFSAPAATADAGGGSQ